MIFTTVTLAVSSPPPFRLPFMLGSVCKGSLSVLHCESCLPCLSDCGLNVCPSTLCIDFFCQLLHYSPVNSYTVLLPPSLHTLTTHFFHVPSSFSRSLPEWADAGVNLCVHIVVSGVFVPYKGSSKGSSRWCVSGVAFPAGWQFLKILSGLL